MSFTNLYKTFIAVMLCLGGFLVASWFAVLATFSAILLPIIIIVNICNGSILPILITLTIAAAIWTVSVIGTIFYVYVTWCAIKSAYRSFGVEPPKCNSAYDIIMCNEYREKLKNDLIAQLSKTPVK